MRRFSYEEIQERILPLFEVMSSDFPSDSQMVITSDYATIEYIHSDMVFNKPEKTKMEVCDNEKQTGPNQTPGGLADWHIEICKGEDDCERVYLMDKPSKEEAENVFRWDLDGLFFSATGYKGPYVSIG